MLKFPSVNGNGKKPPQSANAQGSKRKQKEPFSADANGLDFAKLSSAMRRSRRVLEFFRDERRRAVIQYVGRHWSRSGANRIVPINLIARYVTIMSRNLISKNPRCMLSTMRQEMKPSVDAMQSWINQRFIDTYFCETLARFVTDAMYCVGIMKVGVASPVDSLNDDYTSEVGEPFADTVDLDDFAFDIGATQLSKVCWAAHRVRMPYDDAVKLKYFSQAERDKLAPDSPNSYNEEGDESIRVVGRGWEADGTEDYREMVTLWEVYFPGEKRLVTLAADARGVPAGDAEPLAVKEWFGPKCGPYHYLGFGIVPGNAMPKAPIMDLIDLHTLANRLYRKTGDQAERQKTNLILRGSQAEDGRRITSSSDGDPVMVDDPQDAKEISWGGPNPAVIQYQMHIKDLFNVMAGNLDLLSGSGPQSKTATQDKMLNENASSGVADLQEQTVSSVARICASLLELWWYHPTQVMSSSKSLPGLPDMEIKRDLYPGGEDYKDKGLSRRGSFKDLQVRIDPYSMRYRSPEQRVQFLMGIVKEHLAIFPMLQQSGIMFDWQEYFKIIASYMDEPDIMRLFTIQEPPPPQEAQGGPEAAGLPSSTSREYTRRSVGQDTQANKDADVSNNLSQLAAAANEE